MKDHDECFAGDAAKDWARAGELADAQGASMSRRAMLQAVGAAAAAHLCVPLGAFGQGNCQRAAGTAGCSTAAIPEVFAPTGWKTVALDHLTLDVADYRKEAAFYVALMGWRARSDDGRQAVVDTGEWGSVIFRQAPLKELEADAARTAREYGHDAGVRAIAKSFCFVIEPWDAKEVEAELRKRGLAAQAENDGQGFESFHVKDPDGFDLQISNGNGLVRSRRTHPSQGSAQEKLAMPLPFAATGWRSVWLDHLSFQVTNYKESASFYCNLLGWTPTYDEGSQNQCQIGNVGDIIIRGGNPFAPDFAAKLAKSGRGALVDHMSFGIEPWDADGVRAGLEKRGLEAHVDTASGGDIHSSVYKSYHTTTPNGYDLQISDITRETRGVLPEAVRPRGAQ
jgi:catechol 2,3-dioxygenase-like lactoylglutathione lyase family enzyme